jgi:hypothetical protein
MLMNTYVARSILVLLIVLGSASLGFSQGGSTEPVNQIILKVTAPNGTWAIAAVFEGEMLTMVDEKTFSGFGFAPIVRNAKDRTIEVRVLPITQNVLDAKPVENLQVTTSSPKTTGSSFKVEVQAISRHLMTEEKMAHAKASSVVQNCCVNCGGFRICANCSVSTECGCCCTGRDACCQICQ